MHFGPFFCWEKCIELVNSIILTDYDRVWTSLTESNWVWPSLSRFWFYVRVNSFLHGRLVNSVESTSWLAIVWQPWLEYPCIKICNFEALVISWMCNESKLICRFEPNKHRNKTTNSNNTKLKRRNKRKYKIKPKSLWTY